MSDDRTMCLKIYRANGEILVAVCDFDILGRTFDEDELHLDVTVDFFGEDRVSVHDVEIALDDATIANIVGERAVACAVELNCIDQDNVLHIDGVPCAQMVRM
ncbi:MAG: DUF424 domain-containing protein [Methanotrichaceae archaeon]